MVAMILAWQRDLRVLHHSQGSIVANCSYLGGSVIMLSLFFNGSVPFFSENFINIHIFSTTYFFVF